MLPEKAEGDALFITTEQKIYRKIFQAEEGVA